MASSPLTRIPYRSPWWRYFWLAWGVVFAVYSFLVVRGWPGELMGAVNSFLAGWWVNENLATEPWRKVSGEWQKIARLYAQRDEAWKS